MIIVNQVNKINIVYIMVWICVMVISVEIFSYLWHRVIAHEDYVEEIHITHRAHHQDKNIDADEDFIWLLFLLILFELVIGILLLFNIITFDFAIVTVITAACVFFWNWFVHRSYHNENAWLNKFQWFREDKARHFIHHDDPSKNYGIASSFMDKIFSTHRSPLLSV